MAYGLSNYDVLAIKAESGFTYAQPLNADYDILFHDIGKISEDWGYNSIGKRADNTFNTGQMIVGARSSTVSGAKFPMQFDGLATTPGKISKILKASGLVQGTETGAIISFAYNGKPTCDTISAAWQGQTCAGTYIQKQMSGAICSLQISSENAGSQIIGTVDISGASKYGVPGSPLTTLATTPLVSSAFLDAPVTIDGDVYVCKNFNLTMGATPGFRRDSGAENGTINAYFQSLKPEITLTLEDFSLTKLYADNLIGTVFATNTLLSLPNFNILIEEANINDYQDQDLEGLSVANVKLELRKFKIVRK